MELSKYVRKQQINLKKEEIIELFKDREANKDTIVKSQLALALNQANKYSLTTKFTIDECFSFALEAILTAINSFNPEKSDNFTGYASMAIKTNMIGQIKNNGIIKVGTAEGHQNVSATTISDLNTGSNNDGEYSDFFEIYDYGYQSEYYNQGYTTQDINDYLDKVVPTLFKSSAKTETLLFIIKNNYGIGCDKMTETEIAKILGITKQGVGQKKFALLDRLKEDETFKKMLKDWNF